MGSTDWMAEFNLELLSQNESYQTISVNQMSQKFNLRYHMSVTSISAIQESLVLIAIFESSHQQKMTLLCLCGANENQNLCGCHG